MSKILIAGLGDVGQNLANELIKVGHEVWGLKRQAFPKFEKIKGCHLILADLVKPTTLVSLPQDIDYVVYCPAPDNRSEESYRQIFIQGFLNLCSGLNIRAIDRFFYISSTGVFGQSKGEWVDEFSETRPTKYSGKILLEAEVLLHRQPMPTTAIRFGGIYGPGRHQMLSQLMLGNIHIQKSEIFTNRIHRNDAARMLCFLIEKDRKNHSLAETYIGVDDKPCSKKEIYAWLVRNASKKFGEEFVKPVQYIEDKERMLNKNKRCSNKRIKDAGFVFQFSDYESGYLDVLEHIDDIENINK